MTQRWNRLASGLAAATLACGGAGTGTGTDAGTDATTSIFGTTGGPEPTPTSSPPDTTGDPGGSSTGVDEHEGPEIPGFTRCHTGPLQPNEVNGLTRPLLDISPDGSVLTVMTPSEEIRRFTFTSMSDCRLAPDNAFGTAGVLLTPDFWQFNADVEGRIVGTGYDISLLWPAGQPCVDDPLFNDYQNAIGFTDKPGIGYTAGLNDAWRVDFTGDGCGRTPWPLSPYPPDYISAVGVDGQGLVHISTESFSNNVHVFDPSGTQVAQYDPCLGDEGCAGPGVLSRCRDDMCILDYNLRRINRFKGDGSYVGAIDLAPLDDMWNLYPLSFGSNPAGDMYVLLVGSNDGPYNGLELVVRVEGLP